MVIVKACAVAMIAKGIHQWNEQYPTSRAFERDVERDELYVLIINEKIRGTLVISTFMDVEYEPVEWLVPNGNSAYIHRLSVHPSYQGLGYARRLMDFAEKFAKDNKFSSVRLDTFSQNKRNQKFYETRGYQRLGDIYYPKQSEHSFHCYELVL